MNNPVDGIARPKEGTNQGKTSALSDSQARALLNAPKSDTLKGKRDRAILAVFLYHALRRDELCRLRVRDIQPPPPGGPHHLQPARSEFPDQ